MSMWEDAFARKDVRNRTLMVNGVAVRIVGVAPPRFNGLFHDGDDSRLMMWLPLSTRATILAAGIGGTAARRPRRCRVWIRPSSKRSAGSCPAYHRSRRRRRCVWLRRTPPLK